MGKLSGRTWACAIWLVICPICVCPLSASAADAAASETTVDDVLTERERYQADAQARQRRIDELDNDTLAMLSAYNTESEQLASLQTYNVNLTEMLASQAQERSRLQSELAEIEVVRRELVPQMREMIDTLAQFVDLDKPVLLDERRSRVERLERNMTRSDIDLAEKYRRVIEAYQIEAEYGQTIEAYEGELVLDGSSRTVDYLRVGRVGFYYVTLDRLEAGIWNDATRAWDILPSSALDDLDYALRVARKQAPPDLMPLPLWTPGDSK